MRELALHVLDILQNAVDAQARRVGLTVAEDYVANRLTITVEDDGRGMDAMALARVTDPFYTSRTTRHMGLGLPLLQGAAERAGGDVRIRSVPGRGTVVEARFELDHPDRQPLGDMAGTLMAFLLSASTPDLVYRHTVRDKRGDERTFDLDTRAIRATLDGTPLGLPRVAAWLADYLAEGEAELGPA